MKFKKLRGCKLPYIQQVLIWAVCMNYPILPAETQHKINDMCLRYGGEYHRALFRVLTTWNSVRYIAIEECVSESLLYNLRLKFYNSFF